MTGTCDKFNVGIVGCGFIGSKRAENLGGSGRLVACSDICPNKGKLFSEKYGCNFILDWRQLIIQEEVDIVVICTLHDSLSEIGTAAVRAGKHVLVEKPVGRKVEDLMEFIETEQQSEVCVRVGFNHRFHPALIKAKKIVDSGDLGDLMFIRSRYGHGGRLGYEKEWRADYRKSGGGELVDQGPHSIDLCRMFLGDLTLSYGLAKTFYWDMQVDDNAFLILQNKDQKVAQIHVSCTEWKNLFSMEIYGDKGKLDISGLGGSYGVEKITHYHMTPEMGPPDTQSWEFPRGDMSWRTEIEEFYNDIREKKKPIPGLTEALSVLEIIGQTYKESGYDYNS